MANWTVLTDVELEPGKPARSSQAISLRDNIIAQAEGATGAPKTQTEAIEDDAVTADKLAETTAERDWVNGRTATSSTAAVGTYAMLHYSGGQTNPGTVRSGGLSYASAGGSIFNDYAAGGSWRCMGYIGAGSGIDNQVTLWLRIS